MQRYKVKKGTNTKRSIRLYKEFIRFLNDNNSELNGNFYGTKHNTEFTVHGFEIKTSPEHIRKIIKAVEVTKSKINDEHDVFVSIESYTDNGFLYNIKVGYESIITISRPHYIQFCRARKKLLETIKKNNHELLSVYFGGKNKVLIDFKCGHEPYWINPHYYIKSNKCPICSGKCSWHTKKEFEKLVVKNNHELLTEYTKGHTKVSIDFKCGHEAHLITPRNYISGYGCPKCSASKGVKAICKYISDINLEYSIEFNIKNRFYDIYIPLYNLLVEVHGSQHYEQNNFFKISLEKQKIIDINKKNKALELGYKYIEVDYREHKPDITLKRFKKQFKKIQDSNLITIVDAKETK